MNIRYNDLSDYKKKQARRLATALLKSTEPSPRTKDKFLIPNARKLLGVHLVHPDTLIAAPIYTDGRGKWFWNVVFENKSLFEWGLPKRSPVSSHGAAVEDLRRVVGSLKAIALTKPNTTTTKQTDRVSIFFIPENRFFIRWQAQWLREGSAFLKRHAINYSDLSNEQGCMYALQTARSIVLHYAAEFEQWDGDCPSPIFDSCRNETDMWNEAASFLMSLDVMSVQDEKASEYHFREICSWFEKKATSEQPPPLAA